MNVVNSIIRILEISPIKLYNNVTIIKLRAQLPCIRNKVQLPIIIECFILGDLAYDLNNYYRINDYILVEGYLSTFSENSRNLISIKLNITKLYPFLFIL